MLGLVNKVSALPEKREQLIRLLLQGSDEMPGCLSYIVAADASESDSVWITEVWDGPENHQASLELPAVKAAIGEAMPLIAAFETVATTRPVVGTGMTGRRRRTEGTAA